MDKVSIIVPVYNVENYLSRCIESLIGQTYRCLEILLIDDYSNDSCRKIISEYAKYDKRIRSIFLPKNQGVSIARNCGLDEMTGEWVCFCDADDWFEPTFVEDMLICAKKENANYVICDYQIVKDNKYHIISGSLTGLLDGCENTKVIACGPISSCTHMIHISLFQIGKIRYPVGIKQYEELPVIPVLAKYARKIAIVNKPLYNYYQRGNNSSASNVINKGEENFFLSWKLMAKRLGQGYEKELEYHAIYALLYGEILNLCKLNSSKKQILNKIIQFKTMFPKYKLNPYLSKMGIAKKLFFVFCDLRCILGLRFLAWCHQKIVN